MAEEADYLRPVNVNTADVESGYDLAADLPDLLGNQLPQLPRAEFGIHKLLDQRSLRTLLRRRSFPTLLRKTVFSGNA